MISEVSYTDYDDRDFEQKTSNPVPVHLWLHQHIFDPVDNALPMKSMVPPESLSLIQQRTYDQANVILARAKVGAEIEGKITWGGSEGTSVSGSVAGSVYDKKGNQVQGKFELNNDGSKSASASAKYNPKPDSKTPGG